MIILKNAKPIQASTSLDPELPILEDLPETDHGTSKALDLINNNNAINNTNDATDNNTYFINNSNNDNSNNVNIRITVSCHGHFHGHRRRKSSDTDTFTDTALRY